MVDAFHVTLCDVILTLLVSSSRTITSLLLVINYSQQAFASGSLPDDDIRMSTASFVPSINTANNVIMTTKPEVYIIGQGQTLEAMCEFRTDEFHLFDNPVVWKKSQLEEDVQIHIMGNIFKPFLQTGRFEVEFAPEHPHFCFVLRVSNVTIEDSGNYTCEVRGPKSSILATVTHTVYVRASVRQLYLTVEDTQYSATTVPNAADNNEGSSLLASPAAISPSMTSSRVSATDAEAYSAASGQLTFVDGKPRRIGCVAVGGNPFPTVRVYLNNRDITDSMLSSSAVSIVSGPPGLRHIVSNIQLYGGLVTLGSSDDGSKLRCVASVTGLAPNITESTVEVQYGPIIHCEARTADLDEPNVYLCCQVRARPDVTSLFWIVDVNGTAVVDGDATNGYWSMVTDRNDAIETRLYLSRASRGTFRTYTVVAENAVAETTQQVRLELRPTTNSPLIPWAAQSDRHRHIGARVPGHPPYVTSSSTGALHRRQTTATDLLFRLLVLHLTVVSAVAVAAGVWNQQNIDYAAHRKFDTDVKRATAKESVTTCNNCWHYRVAVKSITSLFLVHNYYYCRSRVQRPEQICAATLDDVVTSASADDDYNALRYARDTLLYSSIV